MLWFPNLKPKFGSTNALKFVPHAVAVVMAPHTTACGISPIVLDVPNLEIIALLNRKLVSSFHPYQVRNNSKQLLTVMCMCLKNSVS